MAVIYVVLLIGILVFVHEFGHYLAAKIFHVKVVSFSIGFGPKLFGFKKWDTSWEVRLLPLGGYCQMLGTEFEDDKTDYSEEFMQHAYNRKPIWQKAIINLAGPLFNLIFPIPILFGVYTATITEDLPPVVGQVLDSTPASETLRPGDMILKIDGEEIPYWTTLQKAIGDHPEEALDFTVLRDDKEINVTITPTLTTLRDSYDISKQKLGRIGITPSQAKPVIAVNNDSSVAKAAGLQSFDEIISVNHFETRSFIELERAIRQNTQPQLECIVLRPNPMNVPYGAISAVVPMKITLPTPEPTTAEALGITSANMLIAQVDEGSPASQAGLQRGDQVLALDGVSVNFFSSFIEKLAQTWEDPHVLKIKRGDQIFDTQIQLQKLTITGEFQEEVPVIYAGFYNKTLVVPPDPITKPFGDRVAYAASASLSDTVDASALLVVYIVKMFKGEVSTKSLGGPIMIGHMAYKAGNAGIGTYLRMMAIISINLGIVNLVPIPLLDGGKLVILLVEAIKRGPLSMRTRQIIAYIGFVLVILLLLLAFKNDFERYWHLLFS